jgi:cytochrome P450
VADLIADAVVERIDRWERHLGRPATDFDAEWSDVTMSVLLRSMFTSRAQDGVVTEAVRAFRTYAFYGAFSMLGSTAPAWAPMPYSRRGPRAVAWIHAFLDGLIAARHREPLTVGTDLLSMLMAARYDDGQPMTDLELRSELMGLIFGGFETTSSALSWTIALLDLHPDVAATAYDEVDALGGRRVEMGDLEHLPYLRACFDEAQRLQGGPMFSRSPVEDDEIAGHHIPRGSIVAVSPYTLHRDPRFWRDPDRFDPGRFFTDELTKNAFIPFGLGPRKCLGMRMAYIEALFALVTAFQRYRFRLEPGFVPRHHVHVSTGMRGGCPVTVHRRRAPGAPT